MSVIPNVLAERYASAAMKSIWSAEGRIILEREFWIAVMKAQKDLGLDIPDGVIEAYERVKDQVNLPSIDARERVTRHDVKARIEEFCELAGCEHIHKGMTSRDLTENVEQLQIWKSMQIIRDKAVAVLNRMSALAEQWKHVTIAGRTHNVAAQTTTMGKRVAMFGEDIVHGLGTWISLMDRYSVRGLKGAVGTQLDQLSLFRTGCRPRAGTGRPRVRPPGYSRQVDECRAGISAFSGLFRSFRTGGTHLRLLLLRQNPAPDGRP